MHTGLWWGDLRERGYLKKLGVDGMIKWIFRKWNWEAWAGLIWLRIGRVSGIFLML
jgi:hypothetical protein